jgi:aspartate racemase
MIGIIGGLGVGATIHYYTALVEAFRRRGLEARLLIAHAEAERVRLLVGDRKLDELAAYLAGFIAQLAAGGATVGVVPAVAPHICFPRLSRLSKLPLVNMLTETAAAIADRGLRRVTLLGTRFVIDTDMYGALAGFDVVRPRADEIELIHNAYIEIVTRGTATAENRTTLSRLAHLLIDREHVDAVVLAGTDLALVFDGRDLALVFDGDIDFPVVDCAAVHIEAIMRRVL